MDKLKIDQPTGYRSQPEGASFDPFNDRPASGIQATAHGKALSPKAQQVQRSLNEGGYRCQVQELTLSTRTAIEAAVAVGCAPTQIVKSLVFRGKRSGRPVLVLASGAHRVNLKALARQLAEPLEMADGDTVRQLTGFEVGGVPPLGHREKMTAYVDAALIPHAELWAAAGTPHALFRLTPQDLLAMTGGTVVEIAGNPLPD